MLNKSKMLNGYSLDSFYGEVGKVRDFYFDDKFWVIRYLILDTGNWLVGKKVLISPYALIDVNKEKKHITTNLTKQLIEDCPSLENDKPVSRQFEENYYSYYGWPLYWSGEYVWGACPYMVRDSKKTEDFLNNEKVWNPNLRSIKEVSTYQVEATDGEIGHLDDFIIDDKTWTIRYLIIDTKNLWLGKKVLVSPQWIESVSWGDSKVYVNLSREIIKQSPEYSETSLLTRDYENKLHKHYNSQGYWIGDSEDKKNYRLSMQR